MTAVLTSHIVLDDRGRPWIEGTNTKVVEVAMDHLAHGLSPEEIHRHHPDLSRAKIYAPLSYYYDHQTELDAEIERQIKEVASLRATSGESPFVTKMRFS
jgi:uncharacterized protein (DUF433 family)